MLSHLVSVYGTEAEPMPDEIAAWLGTLPAHDAAATARLLVEKLVVLNRTPGAARTRVRVLDMLRERADRVRPRLESELEGATLPLAPRARELAHLLEKLLKELGAGYLAAVVGTTRPWLVIGLKRQIHAPLVWAMQSLAARLALCDRLHARAPGGAWAELHRLYRTARELGLHERGLDAQSPTPEALYVRALLLAFAEPTRLMPGEYQRLDRYVADFGKLATLVEPPVRGDGRCAFLVDLRRDRPGAALAKRPEDPPPAGDRFILLTRPLVEQVHVHIARLRSGVSPATLALPDDAASNDYPALLAKVGRSWRGDRRRRSARKAFRPRVSLWVGYRAAWDALATAGSESESPENEWTILNESAGGFALRLARGTSEGIAVGEPVLVLSRERGAQYLCLVRRVQSNTAEHIEIGLQQVAPAAEAVRWVPDIAGEGSEPVFFCPVLAGGERYARLVVPAGALTVRSALVLERRENLSTLHVRRFFERSSQIDVVEVEAI